MTLKEAAEYLRMHSETLRLKAWSGKVPGRKVGGKWLFSRDQLKAWVEEGGGEIKPPGFPEGL